MKRPDIGDRWKAGVTAREVSRLFWLSCAVFAIVAVSRYVSTVATFDDFRAFYCAGAAAHAGGDPYSAEPLHRCELATMPPALRAHWHDVVIPAPLPPYAIALFAGLSLLPFSAAAFLWTLTSIAALAATVLALRSMTRLSGAGILFAIALPVFGASIMLGQTAPAVIAAVTLCAWCMRRGKVSGAAVAAAIALLDPRVGLAVCVSLVLWAPTIRLRLLLAVCIVAAASLAFGFHLNAEYLTAVLPAHQLSEAASFEQYSLTAIIYAFGAPLKAAALVGSLSFLVMLFAGVAAARACSLRYADNGFLVLLPAAFAVIGGPFIHLTQIAIALPALLLFIATLKRVRYVALAALLLLALPWPMAKSLVFVYMAPLLAFAMLWWLGSRREVVVPFMFSAVIALTAFVLHRGYVVEPDVRVAAHDVSEPVLSPYLAEATWSRLMWKTNSNDDALSWAKRIPTWSGLILLVVLTIGRPKEVSAALPPQST